MARITKITKSQSKLILYNYSTLVKSQLFSIKAISGGTVNSLYKIAFDNCNVYLKIDEMGDLKRLEQEMSLLQHLNSTHFSYNLPKPLIKSNGTQFTSYQNKFIYLLTEVSGTVLPTKIWQAKHASQLGQALAQLHSVQPHADAKLHKWNLKTLQSTLQSLKPYLLKTDQKLFSKLQSIIKKLKSTASKKTPKQLIHADAFYDNLHWQNNTLTGILDFEYAGLGNPLYDIALALLANAWTGSTLNVILTRAFLKRYQKFSNLQKHKLSDWRQAFAHAAITIVITRLKTFEFGPLKGQKKSYRDYREFITRYDWTQSPEFDNFKDLTIL